MSTQKQFNDKHNFDDVFLRNVTVGLIRHMHNRLKWTNRFSHGDVEVKVPFHFSLSGDERFVQDAFTDDVAGNRVEFNTDMIPRGIVALKSMDSKPPEFSNPNVPILLNRQSGNVDERVLVPFKAIPVKITYDAKIRIDSELDIMRCWEQLMSMAWSYRYYDFTFSSMPITALVSLPDTMEDVKLREFDFKTAEVMDMAFSLTVHTYYPAIDWDRAKPAHPTDWQAKVYDKHK